MSDKIIRILEEIKTLTLEESLKLVELFEKNFNIDTNYQVSSSIDIVRNNDQIDETLNTKIPEEKTNFDVILTEAPTEKKISILKTIRTITGLGLKECKEIVDLVPKIVKEGLTKEEAENVRQEIEKAGGVVIVK